MTSPSAGSKDATAYLVKIIAVRTAIRMACWILETKKGEKRLRGEDQCFPTIRIEERTKSTARKQDLKDQDTRYDTIDSYRLGWVCGILRSSQNHPRANL